MLIPSLAKRPEICLGDHCFSFIRSITRHLRTGFNALFPGDCPLREHAVSWALFHTYLPRGVLLRVAEAGTQGETRGRDGEQRRQGCRPLRTHQKTVRKYRTEWGGKLSST